MIEARTVDEAYSSACNTSDLTVKAVRRSDVDTLIASGMTPGLLGAAWPGSDLGVRAPYPGETPLSWSEVHHGLSVGFLAQEGAA